MLMIRFETNEYYSSFIAEELLLVVKRTPTTVTFKRESGVEYTVKIKTIKKKKIFTITTVRFLNTIVMNLKNLITMK